jgi:ABC-type lipoprotein export system ATPase subunit
VIEARGVAFKYPGTANLFERLDAAFGQNEMVALTGASGRGKSTLLYLLGLMLQPVEGEIYVSGVPVSGLRDRDRSKLRAHHYGFIFQDAALDPSRTVLDNVIEGSLYRGDSRASASLKAMDLLEQFGVELRSDAKPGQVSGGQAQRIALCRALLGEPAHLLADEPTGNLDPRIAETVIESLSERAREGATVIIATHDPVVIERCDRRLHLP